EDRARTATGNHGLQLFSSADSAGHFLDEFFHIHAEGYFVDARLIYVTRDAQQSRAAVLRSASVGVSLAAVFNDRRYSAERFHIINNGRAPIQPNHSREGRL